MDIELYENSASDYDELQNKRPDYVGAKDCLKKLAIKYFGDKKDILIADFCCGTGKNSKMLSERLSITKATLIDINEQFLEIAKKSGFHIPVETINKDILLANLNPENDLVISMFAYHHVPDNQKMKYVGQVQNALKANGILILGEIYMPDHETTLKYYKHLLDSISPSVKSKELEEFLMQTAKSTHFEYKVSRQFAHEQLQNSGFTLVESVKIWPKGNSFSSDVGTFVDIWRFDCIKSI
jgi:ubiquinone/menaquinone biosynthesis C-methylase UbiE